MTVAASLDNLQPVRNFLKRQAALSSLSEDDALDLIMAVDEALTNIVIHGCDQDPECHIEVVTEPTAAGMLVHLLDYAPPFDPTAFPDPDLSIPLHRRPVGGLGIFMMKQTVDEVTYEPRPGGGNILTLRKSR